MADNEQFDRTEPATQKRLDEAREKGQVPRSRDLTAAAVMLTAGIGLQLTGGTLGANLAGMMRGGLTLTREQTMDSGALLTALSTE